MKKIFCILLLLPHLLHAELEENSPCQNLTDHIGIRTISEDELNDIRATSNSGATWTQPLIIDSSNPNFTNNSLYQLESNIVYNPGLKYVYPSTYSDYPAAIIVAKDNMTIDLNGFNLSLSPASAANFLTNNPTYGIAVYQGVKNLKIISSGTLSQKGSITGFSGYAIYATGILQSYNTYDIFSNYIKNLTIDNILITQNINGIYVLNAIQVSITNTAVIYNFSARPLFGINFTNVLNGFIELCRINQNYSLSDIIAIILRDTTNAQVTDCEISSNRCIVDGNATGIKISAVGGGLLSSEGNSIKNCNINRNLCSYTASKTSIGINIASGSLHNVIDSCNADLHGNVPSSASPPSPLPTGIGIQID
ncbi:MAG: hypothetical protein Q8Q60_00440, partial [Candidatus Chromulinivorax sp.]|nr:hypothetical protein [Candidatus Chromulinivorax sp.]